jgi:hypothetical protein
MSSFDRWLGDRFELRAKEIAMFMVDGSMGYAHG